MPEEERADSPGANPPVSPQIDEDKLGAAIAKGLAAERAAERQRELESQPVTRPVIQAAPTTEHEPTPQEIAAAINAGEGEKVAALLEQRDRIRDARRVAQANASVAEGVAAIGELAEAAVANDPVYGKYKAEVRAEMAKLRQNFPQAVITASHWKEAVNVIAGRHRDDLINEAKESALRASREAPQDTPVGSAGRGATSSSAEPATLHEAFGDGFTKIFNDKARAFGGRSEEEEVRRMGYRGGLKEYFKERREMEAYAAEHPSLGLDE